MDSGSFINYRLNETYVAHIRFAIIFAAFMRRIHYKVRATIFKVLDFFYPLFKKFMPLQTYHYAACGGLNTVVGWVVYFYAYHFIFEGQVFHTSLLSFEPHSAALFVSFLFTFPLGFYLSMFVIFQGSYLKRRVQLFRYFLVLLGCMVVNYICLKIFVEMLGIYPTPSQIITTGFVILFNYFFQRNFSFKSDKEALRKQGLEA